MNNPTQSDHKDMDDKDIEIVSNELDITESLLNMKREAKGAFNRLVQRIRKDKE